MLVCGDVYEIVLHNEYNTFDDYDKVYEVVNDMEMKSMDDPSMVVDIEQNFVVVVVLMHIDVKHLVNEWNQTETENKKNHLVDDVKVKMSC